MHNSGADRIKTPTGSPAASSANAAVFINPLYSEAWSETRDRQDAPAVFQEERKPLPAGIWKSSTVTRGRRRREASSVKAR
ncbi:hypothetical protein CHARACLAT_033454 [Characodon lateralis]|uniref:Uncharacterized protein n=1 Tax=Characodon lateralis TaxID=208331 RepID=A0ABU7DWZ0_9TELE|nr:hypothetical protein [Characodon lateralis]